MTNSLPSLAEIRRAHSARAQYERYLAVNRYFFRPLSYGLTWLAIRAGLSSEAVSWLSGAAAAAGLACLLVPQAPLVWPGLALLALFNFLDCADGDISRAMRTRNPYGRFLDSIMGFPDMLFWAAAGLAVSRLPELRALGAPPPETWLWAGAAAAFLSVYAAYLESVFDLALRPHWETLAARAGQAPAASPLEGRPGPLRLGLIVLSNLRVRETHYALLCAAGLAGAADLLLLFYLALNLSLVLFLLFVYCRRGLAVRAAGLGREGL